MRLGGQRLAIRVPRVRGPRGELALHAYGALKGEGALDETLLKRVRYGISCRNYEAAAEALPGALGLSSSSVSRTFIKASAAKLKIFQARELAGEQFVALIVDGKTAASATLGVALGVTLAGEKRFLGFIETGTENEKVLAPFLRALIERGLDLSAGLLVILDGGKGLRAAVKRAYDRPTYKEARAALEGLHQELDHRNQSAAANLAEGIEETLTLHRLGIYGVLGRLLKTTNCLESVNALIEERCAKVDAWKNSNQRQRWLATALLDIESRLNRVRGFRYLPKLRQALIRELNIKTTGDETQQAA